MMFQQDGTPAHFSEAVKSVLEYHFLQRWTGIGEPMHWPPSSPVMHLDNFFWGYIKAIAYRHVMPADIPESRQTIQMALESVTTEMLTNLWKKLSINWIYAMPHVKLRALT